MLALKVFRPFPADEIHELLTGTGTIIVMDRANSQGAELTPLATEVQSAVQRRVLSLEYGRGGRNTPLNLVKEIYRLGFLLNSRLDTRAVQSLLKQPKGELAALLGELRFLEGDRFADKFVGHLAAGRLIEAFGPREHIDVRESSKRRAIKLQIIKEVTGRAAISAVGHDNSDLSEVVETIN